MFHVSCIMYHVSCVMYHVSSIMYHVSSIMYHVSCIMYHVFCIMMYHISCIMYHVSSIMCHVSCIMYNVSCIMCSVSCIMCPVSLYQVSCDMLHVLCILYPVSCVLCPVSYILVSCIMYQVSNPMMQCKRNKTKVIQLITFRLQPIFFHSVYTSHICYKCIHVTIKDINRVSKKRCDQRRLFQNCTFLCATLLYSIFSINFLYSMVKKNFSQNPNFRKARMCVFLSNSRILKRFNHRITASLQNCNKKIRNFQLSSLFSSWYILQL